MANRTFGRERYVIQENALKITNALEDSFHLAMIAVAKRNKKEGVKCP